MNSFINISGLALWIFLACAVTVLISIIGLGMCNLKTLKENGRLKLENELLHRELERGQYSKYKATFKVPEVE